MDDEEGVRRALLRLLRSGNFDAHGFASNPEFLASLSNRVPACVVLDIHMPQMSGLQVQELLKTTWTSIGGIMETGYDTVASQALAAMAVSYLTKLVGDQSLRDAINACVGQGR